MSDSIHQSYSKRARTGYWFRRNAIFLIVIITAFVLIGRLSGEMQENSIILSSTQLMAHAQRLLFNLLVLKFTTNKLELQTQIIEKQNVAAAIVAAAIILSS